MGIHSCHRDASCINTQGSYECQCDTGYSGDGYDNCWDVENCVIWEDLTPNSENAATPWSDDTPKKATAVLTQVWTPAHCSDASVDVQADCVNSCSDTTIQVSQSTFSIYFNF